MKCPTIPCNPAKIAGDRSRQYRPPLALHPVCIGITFWSQGALLAKELSPCFRTPMHWNPRDTPTSSWMRPRLAAPRATGELTTHEHHHHHHHAHPSSPI